ncbi:hypothetical protein LguiA_035189 [Lonicera macranthoides]
MIYEYIYILLFSNPLDPTLQAFLVRIMEFLSKVLESVQGFQCIFILQIFTLEN